MSEQRIVALLKDPAQIAKLIQKLERERASRMRIIPKLYLQEIRKRGLHKDPAWESSLRAEVRENIIQLREKHALSLTLNIELLRSFLEHPVS